MTLKAGDLFWPTTARAFAGATPLDADVTADVLVAGTGITGAFVAHHLARAGLRVVMVDRRAVSTGSTPASTALVQYDLDVPLVDLVAKRGPGHAHRAYLASRQAIVDMETLIGSLPGGPAGVDMARRPSLYLAAREGDLADLEREAAARRGIGLQATLLSQRELAERFAIPRPGAILTEAALEVNPVKLTAALLGSAVAHGARVFDRTDADLDSLAAHRADAPIAVTTSQGRTIRADHAIATGYETPAQFAPVRALTRLVSTFALTTAPLAAEPWPHRALLWEWASPYLYARTAADHRVLIGGEDVPHITPTQAAALLDAKAATLMRKLATLAPHLNASLDFVWTGLFAQTDDGLPFIGAHPRWPRVHFALGYGGNGITFSLIAAQLIRDALTGRVNPDAELFSFARMS